MSEQTQETEKGMVVLATTIPRETSDKFRALAEKEGRSMANYLRFIVTRLAENGGQL
jgi:predicted DNA-binding protein